MKPYINYITGLPDFLLIQRVSFCWFIVQGISEELINFSRILDFSHNTEYILFGQEYRLVKPIYRIRRAKRYIANYAVQLVIPLEVRNKKTKKIKYHDEFTITSLPIMTTEATFIINGCERVIVSQIIRSPGIYFEKNKNQKKFARFKRKFSSDFSNLRSFIISGNIMFSQFMVFLPYREPIKVEVSEKNEILRKEDIITITVGLGFIPNWKKINIFQYSFKYFKEKEKNFSFYFLNCFKIYRIISKQFEYQKKIELIQIFLRWLKIKNNDNIYPNNFKTQQIFYLLTYFNFLLKFLIKYEILLKKPNYQIKITKKKWLNNLIKKPFYHPLINSKILLKETQKKIYQHYNKLIKESQRTAQIQLNYKSFLITRLSGIGIKEINNFSFLKETINKSIRQTKKNISLINNTKLKPTFYFSISLKDNLKYIFEKEKHGFFIGNRKHPYLKTKTTFLQYNQDHEIKDFYFDKYKEKDLYTATLIPEYGSWIRFGFQKNTKINLYKYPIKNQEDEIIVQIDKVIQKPIIHLLKEMGLIDLEIYQSLEHADFFYFDKPVLSSSLNLKQPLLRFELNSNLYNNISEFSRIFDKTYYQLGKIGRSKLNKRLNLNISQRFQTILYDDIFAILDQLITLSISKIPGDDIDHLKNRRVRSVGELLQSLFRIGFLRLSRKLGNQINRTDSGQLSNFNIISATIREFFGSSQLSQYMDQTNPLSSLTHRRRISGLGPGGFDRDRISFAVRDIHSSHYGRICPIETPEGQNVGLIASLTTCARVNKSGFIETPFWRVLNGKVIKTTNPIYLTADIEDFYKIAPADISINKDNYLTKNLIPVRYKQDFINVSPFEVDFIGISTIQVVSVAASLIPFFEHDDANRALMGSNMQRQSVPLILPQKPIIGTGLENQVALDSGMTLTATISGIVNSVTSRQIIVKDSFGTEIKYNLQKYKRSNQETCINHRPIVWKGEKIKSGQILTDGPGIIANELALGQNILIAYMPWQGYNFEDAILINERLVYNDIFTSIHIERYEIEIDRTAEISEQTTKNIPNLSSSDVQHLNNDGIISVGTFVKPGDILVGKIIAKDDSEQLPEAKLLRAIFGAKAKGIKDTSFRMPSGESGRVLETLTINRKTKLAYEFEKIYIVIAKIRKIQVGDKIAGRHGNKGIISRIMPRQDMPFLPDGTPIDIILNPLGVPSRMNVGQLYECLLGFAGHKLNRRFKILPFDEMYGQEVSRILINKKLRQASIENNEGWLFNPYAPGKMVLIDGRTGKEFENPITVGNGYMLKLIHLVDYKMHSRATGPYSLVTQQPLGGKAQHGGQRFGEMEVWALEGFGAAFTLKELLTIKSDDMQGRNETLNAIVKGQPIPTSGIPESFKVLLHELRSIGLDMSTYYIDKFSSTQNYETEVNITEKYDPLSKTFLPITNMTTISF
uniref:DNA-directed RNA polymerase subunit beta n=1 Tax=Biddulphia biddulphiana TaxID=1158022 RepID=A0A2U9NT54_9STRA|nr:RNA polymerase beta subunit [Biddulphia biddulphiana]AWT40066.1 RNA polymerase beta subunit [Biddulphia biddulphiana]